MDKRTQFMADMRRIVEETKSHENASEMAIWRVLTLIDGVQADRPPITLTIDGTVINEDVYLHDLFYEEGD